MRANKLLSLLLALVMCLSLIPTAAFADDPASPSAGGGSIGGGGTAEVVTSDPQEDPAPTAQTLKAQFDAATGEANIELAADVTESVTNTNTAATSITVDLNGHTWTSAEAFTLKNDGCKIILKDSSGGGKLTNTNTTQGQAVWARTGAVEIQSGTYENNSAFEATIYAGTSQDGKDNAAVTITGGTFKNNSTEAYIGVLNAPSLNASQAIEASQITLNGGTFYNNDPTYDDVANPLCKNQEGYNAERLFTLSDNEENTYRAVKDAQEDKWVVMPVTKLTINSNDSTAVFNKDGNDFAFTGDEDATFAIYESEAAAKEGTPESTSYTVKKAQTAKLTVKRASGQAILKNVELWITATATGKTASEPVKVTLTPADALETPTAALKTVAVDKTTGETTVTLTVTNDVAKLGTFYDVYAGSKTVAEQVELVSTTDSNKITTYTLTFKLANEAFTEAGGTQVKLQLVATKSGVPSSEKSDDVTVTRSAVSVKFADATAQSKKAKDTDNNVADYSVQATTAGAAYAVYSDEKYKTEYEGAEVAVNGTTMTLTLPAAVTENTTVYVLATKTDCAPARFSLTIQPFASAAKPEFVIATDWTTDGGTAVFRLTDAYSEALAEDGDISVSFLVYNTATATDLSEYVFSTVYEPAQQGEEAQQIPAKITLTLNDSAFDGEHTTRTLWIATKTQTKGESARTEVTVNQNVSPVPVLARVQGQDALKFESADDTNFKVSLVIGTGTSLQLYKLAEDESYEKVGETIPVTESSGSDDAKVYTINVVDSAKALTGGTWYITNTKTGCVESDTLALTVAAYQKSANATLTALAIKSGEEYNTPADAEAGASNTYSASVANAVNSIKVSPTLTGTGAYVKVNGGDAVLTGADSAAISLPNVGTTPNTITVDVYAENGTKTATYTLSVTRAAAQATVAAGLKSVAADQGAQVQPGEEENHYTIDVGANVDRVVITATPLDTDQNAIIMMAVEGDTLAVRDQNEITVDMSDAVEKAVSIRVISSSGATKDYTATVKRANNVDVTLNSLNVYTDEEYTEEKKLNVTPDNNIYTATVTAHGPQTVYLAVKPTSKHVTVKIGSGNAVAPDEHGFVKMAYELQNGENTIPVTVYSENYEADDENAESAAYTVKANVTPKSSDNTLSALEILTGSSYDAVELTPDFDPNKTAYAAEIADNDQTYGFKVVATKKSVDADVKIEVKDAAGKAITADEHEVYKITPKGESTNATVTITVTPEDESTARIYTVTVTQKGKKNIATLDALTVQTTNNATSPTTVIVSPSKLNFSTGKTEYTLNVASDIASMTVTPTVTAGSGATVTVNGKPAATPVNLRSGETTIEIVVTAQDGSTKQTYTLTVTKAEASNVTTLSSATVAGKTIDFANGATQQIGNVTIAKGATQYTVSATATDSKAKVVIVAGSAEPGSSEVSGATSSATKDIAKATGKVTIYVQAENGDRATYTIDGITAVEPSNDYKGETEVAAAAATATATDGTGTVTATTTVDASAATNIGADTTEVNIQATGTDADVTNVALPAEVVTALKESGTGADTDAKLTLKTDAAEVSFSNEALQKIAETANAGGKAGTATIEIAKPAWSDPARPQLVSAVAAAIAQDADKGGSLASQAIEVVSVEVKDSTGAEIPVAELENKIEMTIQTEVENAKVFYVDESSATMTVLRKVEDQVLDNGMLTFKTSHLSNYVVLNQNAQFPQYNDGLTVPSGSVSGAVKSFTIDGYNLNNSLTVQTEANGGYSSVTFTGMGPSVQINTPAGAKISVWETTGAITFDAATGAVNGDFVNKAISKN